MTSNPPGSGHSDSGPGAGFLPQEERKKGNDGWSPLFGVTRGPKGWLLLDVRIALDARIKSEHDAQYIVIYDSIDRALSIHFGKSNTRFWKILTCPPDVIR